MYAFFWRAALFLVTATAQNLCDDDYGKYCPEAVGWGVGDCLKLLDLHEVASECQNFIKLHDNCKVYKTLVN